MKEKNELFVIKDYDTGKPLECYLTNNAETCYNILSNIDEMESEEKDDWLELFEEKCKRKNIKLERFEKIYDYDY